MKRYTTLYFFLFFAFQGLNAQILKCKINGTILTESPYRYAYLYMSDTELIDMVAINNNIFQFSVNRKNDFETGILFLSKDSLNAVDAINLVKKGIDNSRLLAIENLDLVIKSSIKSAIVTGGKYNSDISDMLNERNRTSYKEFFEKHADSPVSLIYLRTLYLVARGNYMLRSIIKCRECFNLLSSNLKNSEEGKDLWKKIDTL